MGEVSEEAGSTIPLPQKERHKSIIQGEESCINPSYRENSDGAAAQNTTRTLVLLSLLLLALALVRWAPLLLDFL
jgi:hypothetical protein